MTTSDDARVDSGKRFEVSRQTGMPPFWVVWDTLNDKCCGTFDSFAEARHAARAAEGKEK